VHGTGLGGGPGLAEPWRTVRSMNSTEHYLRAEGLLRRLRNVLNTNDPPDERHVFMVSVAAVHASLAAAAVAGLTADLPPADAEAWRIAAARPVAEELEE
jgi:hypothetical protein